MIILNIVIPIIIHFFNIYSWKARHFAPNWSFVSNVKQLRQLTTSDVTYDVGASTVYCRIYGCKFLTLSNQTSRYIRKRIRIVVWCSIEFFHAFISTGSRGSCLNKRLLTNFVQISSEGHDKCSSTQINMWSIFLHLLQFHYKIPSKMPGKCLKNHSQKK